MPSKQPLLLAAALALAVISAAPAARAQARPEAPVLSATSTGAVGIRERVSDLLARQKEKDLTAPRVIRNAEKKSEGKQKPDRQSLPQNPESPSFSATASDLRQTAPTSRIALPLAPQTIGTSFTSATLQGVNPTLSFPPDNMGAVGPTQFVSFVNGRLVTFNKTTGIADGVLNVDPDVFFSSVAAASQTSDPRVRYDRLTGRWIMVIINTSTPNRILFAVSDAASAGVISGSTVFTYFFINIATTAPAISNTCLADYPTLGVDANALYVGTNNFCGSPTQSFNSTDGYVIRKTSILGAGPIVVTVFRGLVPTSADAGPYTPQGVDNYDPAATEGYFIGVDNQAYGLLQMRRVSNPGGTPTISANIPITVSTTAAPINVNHLGNTASTNGRLSALDDRLFAAHIRGGRLWTAHNIGVNNTGVPGTNTRNGSRWYELNVPAGSGTPTVVQSGTVFTANATNTTDQRSYWVPSIMVSGQGHAAMALCAAGTNDRANAATVGRLSTDALGTMQAPAIITTSATAYNPPSDPGSATTGRRWGDYTYTSLDPLDDMTMWAVSQFCDATNSYGVRVTKLIAPPPATPSVLADVTAGQATVNVTLTGVSASGSGFYDPGANLPGVPAFNHLVASISNGAATGTPPTVVSATYVNRTTVNLVLNASTATANVGAEKYTLTITNPDGQTAAAAVVHVVGGSPVASVNSVAAAEGNSGTSNFTFTVSLSSTSASAVSVNYATSNGTATTADGDYTAAGGTLTIPANTASGTFTVPVAGDAKFENNETFTVTLSSPVGCTIGTGTGTGTINNDDSAPTLTVNNATVAEGNAGTTNAVFTVALSAVSGLPVSVNYATSDGTALIADGDYTAASGTLNIPAGQASGQVTVTVTGDAKYEGNESFSLALASPTGATLGVPATGTGGITNDDAPPAITVDPVTVAEGNAGTTTATFAVHLSAASGLPVSVGYATSDGTATTGDGDYDALTGTLTMTAGQTGGTVTVTVHGDAKFEADEAFSLILSSPTGGSLGLQSFADGTITNDDSQPVVTVVGFAVAEGNSGTTNGNFAVQLSAASGLPVSVDWATADSTATTAHSDYVAGSGTVTFAPGETSKPGTVVVNGDDILESNEFLLVKLSNASGAAIGSPQAVCAIFNDDSGPLLSVDSPSIAEGNSGTSSLVFAVSLSNGTDQPVSVDWATNDGTAAAGTDYVAASGTLVIPAKSTGGSITVTINGDACGEADETFAIMLSNPVNATLAGPVAGTITNDDDAVAPTVSVSAPNGGESLQTGASASLDWSASDNLAVSSVKIELSRDGGSTYPEVIAASAPNTGSYAWTVTGPASATCKLRVTASDANCNTAADESDAAFEIANPVSGVGDGGVLAFGLGPVLPNPSHGNVQFEYALPRESRVRVSILDVQGREVALLASGMQSAGRHTAQWSAVRAGGTVSRGLYFVRFEGGGKVFSRRFAIVR